MDSARDQATARIDALIEGWRTNPAALNRIVKRAAAVVPPVASHSGMLRPVRGNDVIYGLAIPARATRAAAVTILTIALGVGAVTTLFSVAYGVLLRPLPWGDTERLVVSARRAAVARDASRAR